MAKILLVEDDNNLREIYEARLQAEGYTIVSAKDGEEALVLAKAEHPDLIISDVMMPRVSGFEMLDILRNTDGLKDTKIIMLTALGQAEDKTRADSLGADSYLVKSQVTLEDIVKTAQGLLEESPATPAVAPAPASLTPIPVAVAAPPTPQPAPVTLVPVTIAAIPPAPASVPVPAAPSVSNASLQPTQPAPAPVVQPPIIPTPSTTPVEPPKPPAPATNTTRPTPPAQSPSTPAVPLTPATQPTPTTPPEAPTNNPVAPALTQSTSNEEAMMQARINDFVNQPPAAEPTAPPTPQPAPQAPVTTRPTPAAPPTHDTQATDQLVADAVKNLSVGSTPQPAPTTIQPTPVTPAPASDKNDDSVTVAHKKIISPIVDTNVAGRPDLNELLAREGINNIDDLPHQPMTPLSPTSQPYSTPHPPGHVISPNGGGVDPNSIAL